MKAVGFFLAVFLSMLAVFLVATGEVTRWLYPEDSIESLLPVETNDELRENYSEFEYWDPREGRRRLVVRAEFSQETLHGGDPLDKLKRISLRNGIIELPLDSAPDRKRPEEIVLYFANASMTKGGSAMGDDAPLLVDLREGRAVSTEGTAFHFEDLHFAQREDDRGKFALSTDRPVWIERLPHLEVRSATGIRGVVSGDGGFERLTFLPPVTTLLAPGLFDPLAAGPREATTGDGEGSDGTAASANEKTSSRIAIVCDQDLEIDFHASPLWEEDATDRSRERMRITFKDDVRIFRLDGELARDETPKPSGNVFHCQTLSLEIDTSSGKPVPRYAIATWEGDRVQARFLRGRDQHLLLAERLEWFNRAPIPQEEAVARTDDLVGAVRGEAFLSGNPELTGEDVALRAKSATILPDSDYILLEQATGTLDRRKSAAERRAEARDRQRIDGETSDPAAPPSSPSRIDQLELSADFVDVFYRRGASAEGGKALDRFVARSARPRGVVVIGLPSNASQATEASEESRRFRAEGQRLVYDESSRRISLEGAPNVLPRLSFGKSWIEAEKVVFSPDEERAQFDQRVWAHFERDSAARPEITPPPSTSDESAGEGDGNAAAPGSSLPELLELSSHHLVVERDGERWRSAVARGAPGEPVVITAVLAAGGDSYRFRAPEAKLDGASSVVELLSGEGGSEERAFIEFDGGDVQARSIVFDQTTYKARLEGDVRVRLRSPGENAAESRTIHAHVANVEFYPGFRAPGGASDGTGAMARLEVIRKLEVLGREDERVVVRARGFELRGDEARWDGERRQLRITGRATPPEIHLTHEEIHGPVRAREIEYDDAAQIVRLIGSVEGQLHQPPRKSEDAQATEKGRPMVWAFRTSEFEIGLHTTKDGRVELVDAHARQNVDLANAEKGMKLLGDELFYDHARGRIRIFSKDVRLQTLMREHPVARDSAAQTTAADAAPPVDKILAREIFVDLIEDSRDATAGARATRKLLATFDGEVIATFRLENGSVGAIAAKPADLWKVETERMTFEIDPDPEAGTRGEITRAVASGGVIASSTEFRGQGERAEYLAHDRSLRLEGGAKGRALLDDLRDDRPALELPWVTVRQKVDGETTIEVPGTRTVPRGSAPVLPGAR